MAYFGTRFHSRKFIFNKLWRSKFRKFAGKSSGKVRGKFVSKLPPDLVGILRCKWPVSGSHFTHVNLFSINYWGWFRGDLQGDLAANFGVDLDPKLAKLRRCSSSRIAFVHSKCNCPLGQLHLLISTCIWPKVKCTCKVCAFSLRAKCTHSVNALALRG